MRRMHNAERLNEVLIQRSNEAQLVILNLPGPPKDTAVETEASCMDSDQLVNTVSNCCQFQIWSSWRFLPKAWRRFLWLRVGARRSSLFFRNVYRCSLSLWETSHTSAKRLISILSI